MKKLLGLLVAVVVGAAGNYLYEHFDEFSTHGRRVAALLQSIDDDIARKDPIAALTMCDQLLQMKDAKDADRVAARERQARCFVLQADAGQERPLKLRNAVAVCTVAIQLARGEPLKHQAALNIQLGDVELALAEITQESKNLLAAIDAYDRALKISAEVPDPTLVALAQIGFAQARTRQARFPPPNVPVDMADALDDSVRGLLAISASLDRQTVVWAQAEDTLGMACTILAQLRPADCETNANAAIAYHHRAEEVLDADSHPFEFAIARRNEANAYRALAVVKDHSKNLTNAIDLYEDAARRFDQMGKRFDYAKTELDVAGTYPLLAQHRDPAEMYVKGVAASTEALKVFTVDYPVYYAVAHFNRGLTFAAQAETSDAVANSDKAEVDIREAITVMAHEPAKRVLGEILLARIEVQRGRAQNDSGAIAHGLQTLQLLLNDPVAARVRSEVETTVGEAHLALWETTRDARHLDAAITSLDNSHQHGSAQLRPMAYANCEMLLGIALSRRATPIRDHIGMQKAFEVLTESRNIARDHGFVPILQRSEQEIAALAAVAARSPEVVVQ